MVSMAALGIGSYSTISVILLSFAAQRGFTALFFVSIPLAILTGALLFVNISISERFENEYASESEDHSRCPYFWIVTFVIGALMGFFTSWVVQALMWNVCVAVVIWAGIFGFSHCTSHAVNLLDSLLDDAKTKDFEHREIYAEWLKLEHGYLQASFRTFISLTGLLVTGGILGYFLYVGDFWSPGMVGAVTATIWGVVGLWLGILAPLQEMMYKLRDKMRKLACADKKMHAFSL